ncbi:DNA polymerase beta superfamily protein [Desertibacillus haloalkaliphilus]|uniref:DNA polymerase beta superfamily protein n=1 Tax=Desertibacillus haloalkaliphilus TaxID=1328930 RepID=UPI001C26C78A|nr:nucleotidyltransferase domain-containing protein [Desertibacillus haloalkaliphilus]MBU8905365.1 nucleotidyltransferase domain-containing protein [Desertibacillus haloalkaliphilus]
MGRDLVFTSLVGSHNYNLDDEYSDKDYKVFVLPTFGDLYERNEYKHAYQQNGCDYDVHDVRKLVSLLWKANVNFIEGLFSSEIRLPSNQDHYQLIQRDVEALLAMREEIASMNVSYLYRASVGMFFTKMKQFERDIQKEKETNEDELERDIRKHALVAYRILDFLERYEQRGFSDFAGAMRYNERERSEMLRIKHEPYHYQELTSMLTDKKKRVDQYEDIYLRQKPNEKTKKKVEETIYAIVYAYIKGQLTSK